MNKVLDFFNKITGLMVFLILVIVFIMHIQLHHHYHHGGPRGCRNGFYHHRDSGNAPMKKDTVGMK